MLLFNNFTWIPTVKYKNRIIQELLFIRQRGCCLMKQKIDNIYRSYNDNDTDDILFDIYEIILGKLDEELFAKFDFINSGKT